MTGSARGCDCVFSQAGDQVGSQCDKCGDKARKDSCNQSNSKGEKGYGSIDRNRIGAR